MLTVNGDRDVVERQLAAGGLCCPSCGGVLGGWGNAAAALVRVLDGPDVVLVPRRSRCRACGGTHVLLPARFLSRRADAGGGDRAGAGGEGGGEGSPGDRAGAGPAGVDGAGLAPGAGPECGAGAGEVHGAGGGLVTDPPLPAPAGSPLADAVAAVAAPPRRRRGAGGGQGGAVGAGGGGDVRAAAGPVVAGRWPATRAGPGQRRGEPQSSVTGGFPPFSLRRDARVRG